MIRRPPISPLFPYTPLSRSLLELGRRSNTDGPAVAATAMFGVDTQRLDQTRPARTRRPHGDARYRDALVVVGKQAPRSEEHTSELQSQSNIVCRLLLEKKNI